LKSIEIPFSFIDRNQVKLFVKSIVLSRTYGQASLLRKQMQILSNMYVGDADLLHVYNAFDEGLTAVFRIEIGLGRKLSLSLSTVSFYRP